MTTAHLLRRLIFGLGVLVTLIVVLLMMCWHRQGPPTTEPVDPSRLPPEETQPSLVQLEPPAAEVNLDGGDIAADEHDESGWVDS
jgi:hypothetical protein